MNFALNQCTNKILDFISTFRDTESVKKRKLIGDTELLANDMDLLTSALEAIPNDLPYDGWIRISAAYKAGVGGRMEYYPAFERWALRWPENTAEIVRKKWDSIKDAEAGAATVFYEATKRGWINPKPDWVTNLNEDHFVAPDGKDTYVFREIIDPVFKDRRVLQCHSFQGFKKLRDNKPVFPDNNKQKPVGRGTAWVKHAERRTYEQGLTFFPDKDVPEGYYNLWQGWGVKPTQGSWKLMQNHLLHVICGGDQKLYDYLIGWMAQAVQYPGKQGEVAIVIHGAKGVGKNTIGTYYGKIFGQHYLYINSSQHLTGHFNAHLRDAVFVVVDEAFFAGDKRAEGVLKSIITEEILVVEKKGQDVITCRNHMHIIMFSNNEWVVRASGADERRYFVLNVPEERKQEQNYFNALYAEMDNGGPEAMLYDLLRYDLSNFNLRSIPQTHALAEQKIRSLDPLGKWLYDCLYDGYIGGQLWGNERFPLVTQVAHADYVRHHKEHSFDGKPLMTSMWSKAIRSILFKNDQSLITDGGRPKTFGDRHPHTSFPSLSDAREAFDRYINSQTDWPKIGPGEFTLDDMLE